MELSAVLLLLILVLPLALYHFFNQQPKNQTTKYHYKTYPLIGDLLDVIKNQDRLFDWATEVLTDNPTHTMVTTAPLFPGGIITANPNNVEYILKTKHENYPRSEITISMFEDFLGHGIFNSNGEQWHWQRKTASLAFATRSLRGFMVETVHAEIKDRLIPLVEKTNGDAIDIQDVLERFTFDNVCRVLFDVDPGCLTEEGSDLMRSFTETINLLIHRVPIGFVWRSMKWLDIGIEKRLRESIAKVKSQVAGIIDEKIKHPSNNKSDLISHIASSKEHTMENLVDAATNFLSAGKDSTAAVLTWFFWLVLTRPDVKETILEEIRSIRNTNNSSRSMFWYEELKDMHYLHAAITEAMRLYPALGIDMLSCKEDDILPDGTVVKKGWLVCYSAYAMGRMEDIWGRDCREYKPERWLENGVFKPESPFKYSVFHAGPRICLGKDMAYIQMKSIAAFLLERYKIEAVMEREPDYLVWGTLKMKGGLPVKFSKREHNM